MKYFKLNMSLEQAQVRFQKLAGTFHPDKPDNTADGSEFIELKEEYDDLKVILKHKQWIAQELNKPETIEKVVYVPVKNTTNPNEFINSLSGLIKNSTPVFKEIKQSIINANKLVRAAKKK